MCVCVRGGVGSSALQSGDSFAVILIGFRSGAKRNVKVGLPRRVFGDSCSAGQEEGWSKVNILLNRLFKKKNTARLTNNIPSSRLLWLLHAPVNNRFGCRSLPLNPTQVTHFWGSDEAEARDDSSQSV